MSFDAVLNVLLGIAVSLFLSFLIIATMFLLDYLLGIMFYGYDNEKGFLKKLLEDKIKKEV